MDWPEAEPIDQEGGFSRLPVHGTGLDARCLQLGGEAPSRINQLWRSRNGRMDSSSAGRFPERSLPGGTRFPAEP